MDCGGCESKVIKYLQRLEGVDEIDIDMGMQKVAVTGHADQKVLKAVRKTERRAELWPFLPHFSPNLHQQHQYQHHGIEPIHHISDAAPSSHYNYYKHGYDCQPEYGHYQQAGTISMFSNENPNACFVM